MYKIKIVDSVKKERVNIMKSKLGDNQLSFNNKNEVHEYWNFHNCIKMNKLHFVLTNKNSLFKRN